MTTSVLIGSRPAMPAQSITVTANATQEVLAIASDDFYLYHATDALSLCAAMETALDTHTQLAGSSVFLTVSGRVRMTNGTAFSVDNWGTDTSARDLLGYTGTLGSSTAHVAPAVSPIYWAPGRDENPRARLGSDGIPVHDTQASRSAPGQVVATSNNEWAENTLEWRFIDVDRFEQVPAANGTWATFWDQVLRRYRRFWVARQVTEDLTDTTTAMTLSTRIPASLPYILDEEGPIRREHRREIARLEAYGRVQLPVHTASEYT